MSLELIWALDGPTWITQKQGGIHAEKRLANLRTCLTERASRAS